MDTIDKISAQCLWANDDGICAKHSDAAYREPCVERPCPDMQLPADTKWLLDKIRRLTAQLEQVTAERDALAKVGPLTEKDLRTLGAKSGKPLWVEIIPDRLWQSRWVIIGSAIQTRDLVDVGVELGAFGNNAAFYYSDYGKTWLAYLHRP